MISRRLPAGCVPRGIFTLLAITMALSTPAEAAAREWQEVLERAAEAARRIPYEGEALLVSVEDDEPSVTRVRVRSSTAGGLVVGGEGSWQVALSDAGGGLLHEGEGWAVPLPGIDLGAGDDFRRLREKYDVAVTGIDHLMGRPCTTLAISRRTDGALRERLWVDDESGLVVRRERYEHGAEPVRLAAFLSLELDAAPGRRPAGGAGLDAPGLDDAPDLDLSAATASATGSGAVDGRELSALRQAGWAVPDALPGGYHPVGVYAVDAVTSQPLQLVYSDGLYVVSVFQQRGRPDWSSLPSGAAPVGGLGFPAYEWPGAMPQRLVWQAGDRTWSIVGDAPEDELLALATALPRPAPPGVLERISRGLGRLWAWVTP